MPRGAASVARDTGTEGQGSLPFLQRDRAPAVAVTGEGLASHGERRETGGASGERRRRVGEGRGRRLAVTLVSRSSARRSGAAQTRLARQELGAALRQLGRAGALAGSDGKSLTQLFA